MYLQYFFNVIVGQQSVLFTERLLSEAFHSDKALTSVKKKRFDHSLTAVLPQPALEELRLFQTGICLPRHYVFMGSN